MDMAAEHLLLDRQSIRLDNWHIVGADGTTYELPPLIMDRFGGTGFEFTADG